MSNLDHLHAMQEGYEVKAAAMMENYLLGVLSVMVTEEDWLNALTAAKDLTDRWLK